MKTTLILLFFSFSLYSQDIDYLKSQDTLYLVLSVSEHPVTIKKNNISYSVGGNGHTTMYNFNDNNRARITLQTFNRKQGYAVFNRKVKTSLFVEKNKGRIIDADFIDQHGLGKVFVDIMQRPNKKVLYIINQEDLKRKKIIVKRAVIEDSFFIKI